MNLNTVIICMHTQSSMAAWAMLPSKAFAPSMLGAGEMQWHQAMLAAILKVN